jgi:hypothetical protein
VLRVASAPHTKATVLSVKSSLNVVLVMLLAHTVAEAYFQLVLAVKLPGIAVRLVGRLSLACLRIE